MNDTSRGKCRAREGLLKHSVDLRVYLRQGLAVQCVRLVTAINTGTPRPVAVHVVRRPGEPGIRDASHGRDDRKVLQRAVDLCLVLDADPWLTGVPGVKLERRRAGL